MIRIREPNIDERHQIILELRATESQIPRVESRIGHTYGNWSQLLIVTPIDACTYWPSVRRLRVGFSDGVHWLSDCWERRDALVFTGRPEEEEGANVTAVSGGGRAACLWHLSRIRQADFSHVGKANSERIRSGPGPGKLISRFCFSHFVTIRRARHVFWFSYLFL